VTSAVEEVAYQQRLLLGMPLGPYRQVVVTGGMDLADRDIGVVLHLSSRRLRQLLMATQGWLSWHVCGKAASAEWLSVELTTTMSISVTLGRLTGRASRP